MSEEEFLANEDHHDLAERHLHLAVECMIDIGNHILSDRGLAAPSTYREVFDLLGQQGLLSKELAGKLRGWAGFRNVLVHMYLDVDHRISYQVIAEQLEDLVQFRQAVAKLD